MLRHEEHCWNRGVMRLAGIDEAGRGPLAGPVVAAASVVAKVQRDRIMLELAAKYPQYGFERHKGYGTPEHLEALRRFGPCPVHRATFAPVAQLSFGF